jgi:5,5'-dehydrodivanillate O-demethylase oxygenase subunit
VFYNHEVARYDGSRRSEAAGGGTAVSEIEGTPNTRYTSADYKDFAHTGPGTLAGRYLRRFWQPVYLAADLPTGHAKPIKIMGEEFTLYRGEGGTPHVVAFRCAHRGTQLSTGWVEGDCIRCFYHGWKYDGSGQCVEMPAEDPSFPPKVQIKSYPTEEYLGLIFAYLGEGPAPLLPRHPELEVDAVRDVNAYTRHCNYFQNVENSVDEVHAYFTHRQRISGDYGLNVADIPRLVAEETEYGLQFRGTRADGSVRQTAFLMPNLLRMQMPALEPSERAPRDYAAWRVPIDDESHKSFNVQMIHLPEAEAPAYWECKRRQTEARTSLPPATDVVAAVLTGQLTRDQFAERPDHQLLEDDLVQQGQGAIADRQRERLGRSDAAILVLRQIWARELQALAEGQPLKRWLRPERLVAAIRA